MENRALTETQLTGYEKHHHYWTEDNLRGQPYDYKDKELIMDNPEGLTDFELARKLGRCSHTVGNKRYIMRKEQKLMKEKADAKRKQQQIAEEKAKRVPQPGDKDYYTHKFPNGIFYPSGKRLSYCG